MFRTRAQRLADRAKKAAARGNTERAATLQRRSGNSAVRRENLTEVIQDPTALFTGRADRMADRAAAAAGRGNETRAENLLGRAEGVTERQAGVGGLWDDITGVTAAEAATEAQLEGREEAQGILDPYSQAGTASLDQMQALMGLGGPEAQAAAIQGIENSPGFMAAIQQGENAMLQNASATGGLRGGNTQGALAQFRPQMLSQAIGQQMQGLGGLAGMGVNATSQQANIASGMGDVNASGALAGYQMPRDFFTDLVGGGLNIAKMIAMGGM